MYKINDNYQKLPGSYLFSTIGKKVSAYVKDHPDQEVIRLGIGDVTLDYRGDAPGRGRDGLCRNVSRLCAGTGV